MAKESRPNNSPESLKAEIARSRERVDRDLRGLRYELDFPRKIRQSLRQQTVVWAVAAVAIGVVVVALPRGKRRVYVEANSGGRPKGRLFETGFLLGALRVAATLLKPAITSFIRQRMAGDGTPRRPESRW